MIFLMRFPFMLCISLGAVGVSCLAEEKKDEAHSQQQFKTLLTSEWKHVFEDSCTRDWHEHWTLDGEKATITHSKDGMDFVAGPEAKNDAHHAVLWTKQEFKGDLKIEYDYTRLDKEVRMVTIIYIQATGSGKDGFARDISQWADKRVVPSMKTYFQNMNTYHISYAAFGTTNNDPTDDYIRGRRYMCKGLKGTELANEYLKTGLFETGVKHHITIIKQDKDVFFHVKNAEKELLCHFENKKFPAITEGRIGLRHMYTRGARYANFMVSQLATKR